MRHHLSLPSRPSPFLAVPSDNAPARRQSVFGSHFGPPCRRPSSAFSRALPPAIQRGFGLISSPEQHLAEESCRDRAIRGARGLESSPSVHGGVALDWRRAAVGADDAPDPDQTSRHLCSGELPLDSDDLIAMMNERLQLGCGRQTTTSPGRVDRPRSASSEYPCNSASASGVASPASTMRVNRLSLADLSNFSRGNDRLSYLRSNSPASSTAGVRGDSNNHEAMQEATTAISGWQDEPRPLKESAYNQYELADSSEVLPSDSLSQCLSPLPRVLGSGTPSIETCAGSSDTSVTKWDSIHRLKNQYDGPADSQRANATLPRPQTTKRSASQFSLRSLSKSLVKRPRLRELRRLAAHVYRGGSRHLATARHRWRLQREHERRQFEAWRAHRRRERPADPLKGKPEGGFGTFSFERSRYGNEEWWKEGVDKFEAPSWMVFDRR